MAPWLPSGSHSQSPPCRMLHTPCEHRTPPALQHCRRRLCRRQRACLHSPFGRRQCPCQQGAPRHHHQHRVMFSEADVIGDSAKPSIVRAGTICATQCNSQRPAAQQQKLRHRTLALHESSFMHAAAWQVANAITWDVGLQRRSVGSGLAACGLAASADWHKLWDDVKA